MKRFLFLVFSLLMLGDLCAQTWSTQNGSIYVNPLTSRVGIGVIYPDYKFQVNGSVKIGDGTTATERSTNILYFGDDDYVRIGEWNRDDYLSFDASGYIFNNGNVGIGTTNPSYRLDVNGKLFLRSVENISGWNYSYLTWTAHSLVMGSPVGVESHSFLELKSGGVANPSVPLSTAIRMYSAIGANVHTQKIQLHTEGDCWFNNEGNFGIGTSNPTHKLDVRGAIRANEILVNIPNGADFVFENSYQLMPLSELSQYVQENRHLPEVQSAAEMEEEGVDVAELQIKLLQKVEELTLYVIQQQETIEALKKEINELKK